LNAELFKVDPELAALSVDAAKGFMEIYKVDV
jgi:hypothetical protein